jgi:hypothetical protein
MAQQGQRATKRAVRHSRRRFRVQFGQQFGDVGAIISAGTGVTGRINARRSAQRVHHQPGIVGQRRQAGIRAALRALSKRVLDERSARFPRLPAPNADCGTISTSNSGQKGVEFPDLAGITGR